MNFSIEDHADNSMLMDKIKTEALTPWDIMKIGGYIGKTLVNRKNNR